MTPSWLKLERYNLGELGPEAMAEVEAALASDAEARARLEAIRADDRPPPPLDPGLLAGGLEAPTTRTPRGHTQVIPLPTWGRWVAGALAAAALALVLVHPPSGPTPAPRIAWKGGELALDLDRQREGQVMPHPTAYQPGDRFRVRLSCPPGRRPWALRVFQGADSAEPLGHGDLTCGNGIMLDGAFTLSGEEPVTVCAAVDEGVRALRAAQRPFGLDGVVCLELSPLGD